jgi:hypothetical protein
MEFRRKRRSHVRADTKEKAEEGRALLVQKALHRVFLAIPVLLAFLRTSLLIPVTLYFLTKSIAFWSWGDFFFLGRASRWGATSLAL